MAGSYWKTMFDTDLIDATFPGPPRVGGPDFSRAISRAETGHASRGDMERLGSSDALRDRSVVNFWSAQDAQNKLFEAQKKAQFDYLKWTQEQKTKQVAQDLAEKRFVFEQQKAIDVSKRAWETEERQGVINVFDRMSKLLDKSASRKDTREILTNLDRYSKSVGPQFQPLIDSLFNSDRVGYERKLMDFEKLYGQEPKPFDVKNMTYTDANGDIRSRTQDIPDAMIPQLVLDSKVKELEYDYAKKSWFGDTAAKEPKVAQYGDQVSYKTSAGNWATTTTDALEKMTAMKDYGSTIAEALLNGGVVYDNNRSIVHEGPGYKQTYKYGKNIFDGEEGFILTNEVKGTTKPPQYPKIVRDLIDAWVTDDVDLSPQYKAVKDIQETFSQPSAFPALEAELANEAERQLQAMAHEQKIPRNAMTIDNVDSKLAPYLDANLKWSYNQWASDHGYRNKDMGQAAMVDMIVQDRVKDWTNGWVIDFAGGGIDRTWGDDEYIMSGDRAIKAYYEAD